MNIDSNENGWRVGDRVELMRKTLLKKNGKNSFYYISDSHYICVREASEGQRGILVKILGKVFDKDIMVVDDEPFCMDVREDFITRFRCYSYPFPTVGELETVLEIIRGNQSLMDRFEEARMPVNPDSTFWVNDTSKPLIGKKKLQYYDASTDQVMKAADGTAHCRLTIEYFSKS